MAISTISLWLILLYHNNIYIGEPVLGATNIQLFAMCRYVMKMMSDFYGGEDALKLLPM